MNTRLIQGLFWREWLLHQGALTLVFSVWLFGIWVFPIHPMYFLIPFGVIAACILAPGFGGADASEGSEEFSFALPPTRSQRYLVRLALGGGALLALLVLGLLAGLFQLPQSAWGLLFESTFTVPYSRSDESFLLYGLGCLAPMALFSDVFAAASSWRSTEGMGYLWLRGLFVTGFFLGIGMLVEGFIWKHPTGYVVLPELALWSILRLAYGHSDYRRKEGISGLPRMAAASSSRLWIVLIVVLVVMVIAALLFFTAGKAPDPPTPYQVAPPPVREN